MDFLGKGTDKTESGFSALKFRNLRRNLKKLKQVGRTNVGKDRKRDALLPGKRVSKTGNVYWETRKNRSDASGSKV